MIDYEYSYKDAWDAKGVWPGRKWDVLISAFNSSERVREVFDRADASRKHWFISPEYGYGADELPENEECFSGSAEDEADAVVSFVRQIGIDMPTSRICVDTTGFMRHHLLVLIKHLSFVGVKKFDALYSEPLHYTKKEKTEFSTGEVREVRQISGFEGNHLPDTSNDLLVIGAGYDDPLIAHAAEFKSNAKKVQLLGFPSLRPDMYQENVLRANRAAEQMGSKNGMTESFLSPANDPFITAKVLRGIVEKYSRARPITNLYLCPVSTKAVTLGFGLFYLREWTGKSASMILPYTRAYSRETSQGVGRVSWYEVDLA